ncbi:MAG: protease modulator HflC [Lachnospiraceae bacterium]|nr:protease modulator HflC [Lachnospiraceae bacterium]
MKKKTVISVVVSILVIIAVAIGLKSFHYAMEDEYHLILRFGKIDRVIEEPGLYFINPFFDSVTILPNEVMLYDIPESDVITSDKKTMIVDEFVLWEITDAMKFAQTLNYSISNAEYRIDTMVYNATKNVISSTSQEDVISGRDGRLAQSIMDAVGTNAEQYGMHIISIQTKRLDLPDDNKEAVYERMISERQTIAAEYEAQGEAKAQLIINDTDKSVSITLSNAEAEAAGIIADGEAQYMQILAEAYNTEEKQDFYAFIRALDAAKASMSGKNNTLILDEDSPLARIFMGY